MSDTPMRRWLAALLTLGLAGTSVELWLLGHDEEWRQLVPFGVSALSMLLLVATLVRPSATTIRLFQAAMLLLVITGAMGVWFHYRGNLEFQMEMDPTQSGLPLMLKILHAKTPPALAPGVMAQLGLLGLVYTYRHPRHARPGGEKT